MLTFVPAAASPVRAIAEAALVSRRVRGAAPRLFPGSRRSVRVVVTCSNAAQEEGPANGAGGAGEGVNQRASSPAPVDAANVQQRLLRILPSYINNESQTVKVEQLILQLESLKATPITDIFTELGLSGTWSLLFSSTRAMTSGRIRLREIGQRFDVENKLLVNTVLWSFPTPDGDDQVNAVLDVQCSYKFVGPGRLEVEVQEHKIRLLERADGKQNKVPDLNVLVVELQRALPIEFFDPSGLIDVSYMTPDFRLARFVGKRLAGVRNIFTRSTPPESVAEDKETV